MALPDDMIEFMYKKAGLGGEKAASQLHRKVGGNGSAKKMTPAEGFVFEGDRP